MSFIFLRCLFFSFLFFFSPFLINLQLLCVNRLTKIQGGNVLGNWGNEEEAERERRLGIEKKPVETRPINGSDKIQNKKTRPAIGQESLQHETLFLGVSSQRDPFSPVS